MIAEARLGRVVVRLKGGDPFVFGRGIPLTHRGVGDAGWAALAATGLPLVIYMGVARCEEIQQSLLDAGLARDLREAGLASPAILIIGEVARDALVAIPRQAWAALAASS